MIIIGISSHVQVNIFRNQNNLLVDTLNRHYTDAVIKAGGIPIILPNIQNKDIIDKYINLCDGFILSGGGDINPCHYKNEIIKTDTSQFIDLDESELYLVDEIIRNNKPMIGICRGLQVLNVCQGGSLYEDLSELPHIKTNHNGSKDRYYLEHSVTIENNTKLQNIFNREMLKVNSFHHQFIKKIGNDLKVNSYCVEDKIIEGIEHITNKFVIAVQWHPEAMLASNNEMLPLFKALINSCK